MKLLLDQGLPRSAAELLRNAGRDAVHTGDCGLESASDVEILAAAKLHGQVVVTLDADFHAILALSRAKGPSVIRVRMEGMRGSEMAELISAVLARCSEDLTAGAVVSVTENRLRVRRLPIGIPDAGPS